MFQKGKDSECRMVSVWNEGLSGCVAFNLVSDTDSNDATPERHFSQHASLSWSVCLCQLSGPPSMIHTRRLVFTSLEQLCSCLVGPASWSLGVHHYQFHQPASCFLSHYQYFPWINSTVSSLNPLLALLVKILFALIMTWSLFHGSLSQNWQTVGYELVLSSAA